MRGLIQKIFSNILFKSTKTSHLSSCFLMGHSNSLKHPILDQDSKALITHENRAQGIGPSF